jgi:hypothetical protein
VILFPYPPFGRGRIHIATLVFNKSDTHFVVEVDPYEYGPDINPFVTQIYPYNGVIFKGYLPLDKQHPVIDKLFYAYITLIREPDRISFAPGPMRIGDVGNGTFMDLFSVPWALVYYRDSGVTLYQAWDYNNERPWRPGYGPGDWRPVGPSQINDFLPSSPLAVSLIFDTAAREVAAYQVPDGIYVTRWSQSEGRFVVSGPFNGENPMLLNTTPVHYSPEDSDTFLFYTRTHSGSTTIYYRLQSENYSVERTLINLGRPATPLYILLLPYEYAILGKYQDDPADALVTLYYSPLYPVKLKDQVSGLSLSSPYEGEYIPSILVQDLGAEGLSSFTLSPPTEGNYVEAMLTIDLGTESLSSSTLSPSDSGVYQAVVIVQDFGSEGLGSFSLSSPNSGDYYEVVLVSDLSSPPYTQDSLGQSNLSAPNYGYYILSSTTGTNLAFGKSYTKSLEPDPSYPDSGGTEFTDGQTSSSYADGKSFGYKHVQFGLPSSGGLATLEVTVDLGGLYEISGTKLVSGAGDASYGYYADSVDIMASTDGVSWSTIGSQNNTSSSLVLNIPTSPAVARYVKFVIKKNLAPLWTARGLVVHR